MNPQDLETIKGLALVAMATIVLGLTLALPWIIF
jgi:hypothetical protein